MELFSKNNVLLLPREVRAQRATRWTKRQPFNPAFAYLWDRHLFALYRSV